MPITRPEAYNLAVTLRTDLERRYAETKRRLVEGGRRNEVRALSSMIKDGTASINMSMPNLNRFLKSGQWLNIYEATSWETGMTGNELEEEVSRRIPDFHRQRRTIEKLLRFGHDAHYAALNLGGAGPQRYGVCCVVLNVKNWLPFYTCFGGDPIRACFDSEGRQVLTDAEILSNFAVGEDAHRIAIIRHEEYLRGAGPALDPAEVRAIVEASDSLIELHRHGPVNRRDVVSVNMSRERRGHYWDLARRASSAPSPYALEFDAVPYFTEMIQLLDSHGIPFLIAESA